MSQGPPAAGPLFVNTPPAAQPQVQPTTEHVQQNPNSSQNTLLISEIRDGLLIMNDGSFRVVISCESINFDLMSSREKEGVEYAYQSFLNSLYFPVQIFIRSERVDVAPYLENLSKLQTAQDNMLLGVLMGDYISFIANLSEEVNIMNKLFYIVVPFFSTNDLSALASAGKSIFTAFSKQQNLQSRIHITEEAYTKAKEELANRANAVINGLYQMGIKSNQLDTKQLSALYYNVYNPDTAVREPIKDMSDVTGTYTRKGTLNG